MLRHFLEHYFAPHPSQEVREMVWSTTILNFALASVAFFEPVYLYSLGYSISQILWFFVALYGLYFFLLPFGGRICRHHGYEHSILYSSPFLILYYVALFSVKYDARFLGVALVALVIQKILYWPGYHANLASFGSNLEEGREVSNLYAITGAVSAIAPVVGGFVIVWMGFPVLFIAVAVLILISNLPLLRTPEVFEPHPFSYGAAMKRLFVRQNLRKLGSFMGFGEELIALVLWPIFIILTVPDAVSAGAIVSVSMLLTVLVTLYVGRLTDDGNRPAVLRTGVTYTAASWLLRPFIVGSFGIFLADTFYRVSKNTTAIPLIAMTYDDARRGQVMETVVFFEMALSLGKIAAALLSLLVFSVASGQSAAWTAIFLLAAGFSVLYSFLKEDGGVSA